MGKLSIKNVADELLGDFQATWRMPDGSPLSVNGNTLAKDPFLKAFAIIGSILTDTEEVKNGLRRLETAMLSHIPPSPLMKLIGYAKKSSENQARDLINYYQKGGKKPKDLGSLLAKALEAMERAHKFSGTPATITANVAPQAFVDELLKKRRPFKDPGAGVQHGEYTHRIQWFIVCTSPDYTETCAKTPGDVYEHIGKWFFPDVKNTKTQASSSNLSMWDALVDRAGAPANQFPDGGELDFRNPNKFHPWMLGKEAQGEKNFPILYAYLSARAKKRDKIDSVEYLSQKLYGKSYRELFKEEYGKNNSLAQMPRLVRIAQNTTNIEKAYIFGLDAEDIPITRGPGTGITTRDQFFDKKKHRTA
jgi:hypothetical protein